MSKVILSEGDSALIVRKDGKLHVLVSDHDAESTALVAGLVWSLQNEAWRVKLVERAKQKIETIVAEGETR